LIGTGGQSDRTGSYVVDGNVMRLQFKNAIQETAIFGAYRTSSGVVYAVSLGEAIFNIGLCKRYCKKRLLI